MINFADKLNGFEHHVESCFSFFVALISTVKFSPKTDSIARPYEKPSLKLFVNLIGGIRHLMLEF